MHNQNYYLNAISGSYFSSNREIVAAHEISKERINYVMNVYKLSTLICLAILPFSIWFGPVYRFTKFSETFLFINVLISVLGLTIFSILFITLALRSSSSVVNLAESQLAVSESRTVYLYFAIFSLNLCVLLTTAPWSDRFDLPPNIIPVLVAFSFAFFFSIYRLMLIQNLSQKTGV